MQHAYAHQNYCILPFSISNNKNPSLFHLSVSLNGKPSSVGNTSSSAIFVGRPFMGSNALLTDLENGDLPLEVSERIVKRAKVKKQGRIHGHQLRTGGQGRKCAFSHFSTRWLRTDRRTDGPTDGRTDGRTDRPSYRDARTHLKRVLR